MVTAPPERPAEIQWALVLHYAGLALGALGFLVNEPPSTDISPVVFYGGAAFSLLINVGLIYLAGTGRSWARIVVTLLLVVGTVGNLDVHLRVFETYADDHLQISRLAAAWALAIGGTIAWFLPRANEWYRAQKAATER